MTIQKQYDLFARDIQTNIKHWTCQVSEEDGIGIIKVIYGNLNGKRAEKITTVQTGKNIGKKNETTPLQQALSDAKGKVLKKSREGYKSCEDLGLKLEDIQRLNGMIDEVELDIALPITNTDMEGVEKPMKAQPYFKDDGVTPKITFPCYGQAKLNGFRACVFFRKGENDLFGATTNVVIKSKNGLEYNTLVHIEHDFKLLLEAAKQDGNLVNILEKHNLTIDQIVFDGEVYLANTFLEDISSAVKKTNELTPFLEYHIFDLAIPKLTQVERITLLKQIFTITSNNTASIGKPFARIGRVLTKYVNNHEEAISLSKQWIQEGYEGGIFRDLKATYAFGKRPSTMVKYKERESAEFIILSISDTPENPGVPVFTCRNDINDEIFDVVIQGDLEKRKKYFEESDKYIGKSITVEFYERTKKGVPFHAVGITIRDYE